MTRPPRLEADSRPRICFLSYQHLSELALSVIDDFRARADIEIIDDAFGSAMELARTRERLGLVDAFVSAGANAMLLRGSVRAPVATIKVSGYDLLLALLKARKLSNRVGVVTFRETVPELDAVKALLSIEVSQRSYRTLDEAQDCFQALAAEGFRVIVGSSIVIELAEQQGLHGILAYSALSVSHGIEAAIELARVARLENARTEQLHGVLDSLEEAVLAVDETHRVIALNPPMEQLLGRAQHTMVGVELDSLEPELSLSQTLLSGLTQRGTVLQFARRDWIVNRSPIREHGRVRGAVITLHDGHSIADADTTLRSQTRGRQPLRTRYSFRDLAGQSPAFLRSREAALRFARTELTVLITGESGTGKELFAQAMHQASLRADKPFVAINCSAFPETLLESELFGYEDGAFTGSRKGGKRGLFEAAHTGTLFLDEIGDMPVTLQTRLLRVLQEREVVRLGGLTPIPVDVRVIAATHQPLLELVAERRFRTDLYYRLNILQLGLPALRERPTDIPLLARDLLARAMQRAGSSVATEAILESLTARLQTYAWPGNVRELENVCERLAVFLSQYRNADEVSLPDLALDCPELFAQTLTTGPATGPVDWRQAIRAALLAHGGNRQKAAKQLGISRATLWRRMSELDLTAEA